MLMMKTTSTARLELLGSAGLDSLYPEQIRINIGMATCGLAAGADGIYETLQQRIQQRGLAATLKKTGCIGYCQQEPLMEVRLPGGGRVVYTQVTRPRARALVDELSRGHLPVDWAWAVIDEEEMLVYDQVKSFPRPAELGEIPSLRQRPFFTNQRKIVLRNCGHIDPGSLEEYVARGGYRVLQHTLTNLSPEQVILEIKRSGLRGRGGGGFPTGRKWQVARDTQSETKFIICNGDEGDPGAYMDRTILESDPHSVLEGMVIGAHAIGAEQGYLYIRDEYPLAVEKVKNAVQQAQANGLLGEDILGTGFNFFVDVVQGAGAFVCGEETALIASIEGGLGEPSPKPPYPAVAGLWGKPTVINNVKTWATVPVILERGADWYATIGAPDNAGTVVFSLVGHIANTGLVEVPLGMTLRELLEGIGGGSTDGKQIKAVQTGGPSGGCLPADLFDTPITYEAMKATGSIMGSGGMVVLDESACMVDVARYFLEFTALESCGKCTPCREGTQHLLSILGLITQGQGKPEHLQLLEEVAKAVKQGSLCGLGQTAPNPVLSTLNYFRDEYEEHVLKHVCPTGKCKMSAEV
jgi:NADH:ubiquinone oxidoreductase subunit F (NADH-binding)/(2Fe-2S) ferredoxin